MNILSNFYTFLVSKDTIDNILLSLLSSLIAYIIAMLFHTRFPNLAAFFFWKPFSQRLNIVPSEVETPFDPRLRAGEQSSLLLRGEVVSLSEVLHFFRSQCKTDPRVASVGNEADFDLVKGKNLFIIGGPKYNSAATIFLKEISKELFYLPKRLIQKSQLESNDPQMKAFVGKDINSPDYTYQFHDEIQYAMVVFRKNLYTSGKHVLLVGGLSHAATLAGITWIVSRPFPFWLQTRKQHEGFQAIIQCRVIGQAQVSKIEQVFYQELS